MWDLKCAMKGGPKGRERKCAANHSKSNIERYLKWALERYGGGGEDYGDLRISSSIRKGMIRGLIEGLTLCEESTADGS